VAVIVTAYQSCGSCSAKWFGPVKDICPRCGGRPMSADKSVLKPWRKYRGSNLLSGDNLKPNKAGARRCRQCAKITAQLYKGQ